MPTFQSNYNRLMDHMAGIEIVDTHEHLPPEQERVASSPDFSTMFGHYCVCDLKSAGMSEKDRNAFYSPNTPLEEKWRVFEPYSRLIQDGSYVRAAHIAMEKFYGYARLDSLADAEALTTEIRKANKPGLYEKVLKDACGIRMVLNYGADAQGCEWIAPVIFATDYCQVTKGVIRGLEASLGVSCGSLDSYVSAVWEQFRQWKREGMKGIKLHLAYMRDLRFAPRTHGEAEAVFLRVMEEGYGRRPVSLGYDESRPLQDYLVYRFVEMADEMDVPIVFHTGLQGDTDQRPDDTRPLPLWNLAHRYRRVRFVLLHAGMPWLEEAAMPAKQYPNVYLDMAWAHLMSPEISTRALRTWIDMVPINKILGFGGDYCVVEKVYGHLELAKQNIAAAFASKMDSDGMPLERAKAWIQAMLYDNPKEVFKLGI